MASCSHRRMKVTGPGPVPQKLIAQLARFANFPARDSEDAQHLPPPPSKNQRPQPQIGVRARSTELVALRLFPVIAIRPQFGLGVANF